MYTISMELLAEKVTRYVERLLTCPASCYVDPIALWSIQQSEGVSCLTFL